MNRQSRLGAWIAMAIGASYFLIPLIATFEFSLRERNTGRFPRGLALMLHALTYWLHGRDPLAPLAFEAPLAPSM